MEVCIKRNREKDIKYVAITIWAVLLFGCASTRSLTQQADITYSGGDGTGRESAVVINGAQSTFNGIASESDWIRKNHPGWRREQQAFIKGDEGKYYDRIKYSTPDGKTETIYYDITDFFGK